METKKVQVMKEIEESKLIVIMRGLEEEQALKAADAMVKGGIRLIEVTFDPQKTAEHTAQIIRALRAAFQGTLYVGAGTVVTIEQLNAAREAGAEYMISPNTNGEIIRKSIEYGLVSIPGALSPTEIRTAHEAGADYVKVFPVTALAPDYISSVAAPLSNVKLMAVGGVNAENMEHYFRQGAVGIGVGGNIVNKKMIAAGDYAGITQLAQTYTQKIREVTHHENSGC